MSIYDSELWIADLDKIVNTLPELEELAGKSIMITGCMGLICSAVIDVLIRWNETHDGKIQILAAARDKQKTIKRFSPFISRDWFSFVQYDATSTENQFEKPCNYIIHGASNASPNKIVKEPVETMLSNFVGLKYLLDYAKEQKTKRVLYISSSEVYGKKENNQPFQCDEYGYIDLLNPRNAYSVGKRAAETLCTAYSDEYNIETVIVRPGHIYGPTAVPEDSRVSSAWAFAVARGDAIVMKSDGLQIRSYCYCIDCACAILKVLLDGENAHAYNISNPDSIISIRKMAEILTESGDVEMIMSIPTELEKKGFNPMNNSSLDSTDLLKLGWKGLFDARLGLTHTIHILKSIL